jgi:3-oxoacyl-[acyl-carrier protein] reductase
MGQVAMVTGAASGIGRSLVGKLYAAGYTVTATDVNEAGLREAARAGGWDDPARVTLRALDVRDPAAWRAVVGEVVGRSGALDVLVNVAGVLVATWAHESTDQDVDRTIDVNVKGLVHGTNEALRHMVARGAGHVVNVASIAGLVPVPGLALYSASKHAARAYSIAVAQEVRKRGVFVTAICPTVVATPMMDQQIGRDEASFTFSGPRALTADEVTDAIVKRALVKKPLELVLDVPGSGQGVAAKLGNVFPGLALRLAGLVERQGRRGQERLRSATRSSAGPAPRAS